MVEHLNFFQWNTTTTDDVKLAIWSGVLPVQAVTSYLLLLLQFFKEEMPGIEPRDFFPPCKACAL